MIPLTSATWSATAADVHLNVFTCIFATIGHNLYQFAFGWIIDLIQWLFYSLYNLGRTCCPITRQFQMTPIYPNTLPIKISSKMVLSHTDRPGVERKINVHTTQDSGTS